MNCTCNQHIQPVSVKHCLWCTATLLNCWSPCDHGKNSSWPSNSLGSIWSNTVSHTQATPTSAAYRSMTLVAALSTVFIGVTTRCRLITRIQRHISLHLLTRQCTYTHCHTLSHTVTHCHILSHIASRNTVQTKQDNNKMKKLSFLPNTVVAFAYHNHRVSQHFCLISGLGLLERAAHNAQCPALS